MTDEELNTKITAGMSAARSLMARNIAATAFKDWVHTYLDDKGIPNNPGGQHSKEGCRIGDRLDYVFAEIDKLKSELDRFTKTPGDWVLVEDVLPMEGAVIEFDIDLEGYFIWHGRYIAGKFYTGPGYISKIGGVKRWRYASQPPAKAAPTFSSTSLACDKIDRAMQEIGDTTDNIDDSWDDWANRVCDVIKRGDQKAENEKLRSAIQRAGFAVGETSGDWYIHDLSDLAAAEQEKTDLVIAENINLEKEINRLRSAVDELQEKVYYGNAAGIEQFMDRLAEAREGCDGDDEGIIRSLLMEFLLAAKVAGPEPIPPGVYYSLEHNNFYEQGPSRIGQGYLFYRKWKHRAAEFPTNPNAQQEKAGGP